MIANFDAEEKLEDNADYAGIDYAEIDQAHIKHLHHLKNLTPIQRRLLLWRDSEQCGGQWKTLEEKIIDLIKIIGIMPPKNEEEQKREIERLKKEISELKAYEKRHQVNLGAYLKWLIYNNVILPCNNTSGKPDNTYTENKQLSK